MLQKIMTVTNPQSVTKKRKPESTKTNSREHKSILGQVLNFKLGRFVVMRTPLGLYCILSSIAHTFYMENDAEIFPAHYTWWVAEKGFKMAFVMNKLAMINSCEIILEK